MNKVRKRKGGRKGRRKGRKKGREGEKGREIRILHIKLLEKPINKTLKTNTVDRRIQRAVIGIMDKQGDFLVTVLHLIYTLKTFYVTVHSFLYYPLFCSLYVEMFMFPYGLLNS